MTTVNFNVIYGIPITPNVSKDTFFFYYVIKHWTRGIIKYKFINIYFVRPRRGVAI